LDGKVVLDAGSGAGRFLDVASGSKADVVGVDLTEAVDAARESLRGRDNVHLVQASLYERRFTSRRRIAHGGGLSRVRRRRPRIAS
jgi:predicted rRNA methylase YqxC with S4 and FtsJ domains